jgi:hypothetical protein
LQPVIHHWVHINQQSVIKDGSPLLSFNAPVNSGAPEELYRALQFNYPKFFKMDLLSKWAWVGAEMLLRTSTGLIYEGIDKAKIGMVLMTGSGCLEVDKKYKESVATIASPALFVYTLPNIMLGEICIRHGFKGEQACLVNDSFDTEEISFWVNDLLQNRGMDACICGWVDATSQNHDVWLTWVTKSNKGMLFNGENLQQLYSGK